MPRIICDGNRYALLVDDAPYLMLGAQMHNSSAWPAMMPKVWPAMQQLHVNTVEAPVYWEQLEAQPGRFDFSSVDMLLRQAREHQVHLILLWFGTWKNGSAHYRPEWMKRDPALYPNIVGSDGKEIDSPSPYSKPALDADIRAFTRLMAHLKDADHDHTVLMVQVENEAGIWHGERDYSSVAQTLFDGPVPVELLQAMKLTVAAGANWSAVFGGRADECFDAYSIAHFIQQVAAAGKAVYPLPMYINVIMRDPMKIHHRPPYETGTPNDDLIPLWKAAAPAIDAIAPDIYNSDSARVEKWMDQYTRPDNPLLIVEIGNGLAYARYCYAAVARGTIGYAPFGMDFTFQPSMGPAATQPTNTSSAFEEVSRNYAVLGPMSREIARLSFAGKVRSAIETEAPSMPIMSFANWKVITTFGAPGWGPGSPASQPSANPEPIGRALVAELGEGDFLVTGYHCRLNFAPNGSSANKAWQFLKVEEGRYVDGVFKPVRIWNGDQTDYGLNFRSEPVVLHVTVMTR